MPKPGDVLFHTQFRFDDGEIGKKLIIVLEQCQSSLICLVLKTTSHSEKYPQSVMGCNPNDGVYFVPKDWQKFDLDTYIQLVPIYSIPVNHLICDGINNFVKHKFCLDLDCYRQLMNCLKRYFKDDIPQQYHSILFGRIKR